MAERKFCYFIALSVSEVQLRLCGTAMTPGEQATWREVTTNGAAGIIHFETKIPSVSY